MLVLLSLPLLIISLIQLSSYRRSLSEQAATIARIKVMAAAGALASWLDDHPAYISQPGSRSYTDTQDLFKALKQHTAGGDVGGDDTVIAVFDPQGRIVPNSTAPSEALPNLNNLTTEATQQNWADGVPRMTSVAHLNPYGWSVVVGVPLAENTMAGHSALVLAATWALVFAASIFLGVWAAGRFTNPLRKLAASASTFGEGQLHERVPVETEDEVGALARSFNVMAEHLQTKFAEVQTQGAFIEEVLDGLPLGVAVLDTDLYVRKSNPTFARFIGREAASIAGRKLYEAAQGITILSDVIEDVRRTRRPFITYGLPLDLVPQDTGQASDSANDERKFWDVTIWPITEKGAERGDLIFILSEVSKRVRAEKLATAAFAAERTRAAELESVINQMNEGVAIIDRHGRYKVNPAAAVILGRKRSEFRDGARALIIDMGLRDMDGRALHPSETPLGRALERRESVSGEQLKVVRADGRQRVVSISATPLTGEDGRPEGAVAVFRDITEEVQQHEELSTAYDRLREHDRLKSAFVTNITHELRTPLNVIIGLCQLLTRDKRPALAPLQREAVVRMERNAHSLLELVNDLLDYSRLEAGRAALHLEKVDITEVVRTTVEDYASEAFDKELELRIEVAPELGHVLTDRHKIAQVLSNLIGNAVKFTSAGTITVAAAPLDRERWYLEVRDTGIGISRDALAYIFDEFRQVDDRLARAYGGTGLGLAITRRIVELLEGEIAVESEPDAGSRFRIIWPRVVRQRTGTGSLLEQPIPAPALKLLKKI